MTHDPYPDERYRCRDDEAVVIGRAGISAHSAEHRERGDGPPEWDVLSEDER